jgi:methylenetetrahydrofolate dehydrogenase (NADP+)/methenyltetrahydrofolate cyclohydrolase
VPKLGVVMVGSDPASEVYVARKRKWCQQIGMASEVCRPFGAESPTISNDTDRYTAEKHLREAIRRYNADKETHGIIVQLPIKPLSKEVAFDAIDPAKDVDCFTPQNCGLLMQGRADLLPCTPAGIVDLLLYNQINLAGTRVCVVSRSDIVGKPLTMLLAQEGADSTVTICHDKTTPGDLRWYCRGADIVVVGVGIPGFLKPDMVFRGTTVVDVGISRVEGGVVGDAAVEMYGHAGAITPVPGGVGPMTVLKLLENTFRAAVLQARVNELSK